MVGAFINERGGDSWQRLVNAADPVSLLSHWVRKRPINRAFYKMIELSAHLPPPQRILLLCEAPGGFWEACRGLWPQASCKATSLSVEDAIPFHRSLNATDILPLPLHGDILQVETIDAIAECVYDSAPDLVTADGGADRADLDMAEQSGVMLLVAQAYCALRCLDDGGAFVVKAFEGSTLPTCQVFDLLSRCFAESSIQKPLTSKAANSERYMVFKGFCGGPAIAVAECLRTALVQSSAEPSKMLVELYDGPSSCTALMERLASAQCAAIRRLIENADDDELRRTRYAQAWRVRDVARAADLFTLDHQPKRARRSSTEHNPTVR